VAAGGDSASICRRDGQRLEGVSCGVMRRASSRQLDRKNDRVDFDVCLRMGSRIVDYWIYRAVINGYSA